jgi:ADP-ribosylglycohydrolase
LSTAPDAIFHLADESPEGELFPAVAGALIGAAAGDALGWITEFVRGREHLRKLYRTDYVTDYRPWQKTTGGRFNAYVDYINRGDYSDDTQLSLAMARSLTADGAVDLEHFSKRELPLWLAYARGGGATITAAARGLQRASATWNKNFFTQRRGDRVLTYRGAGANGAAMRIAPLALANINDSAKMKRGIWQTSICTHGHPRAIIGALLLGEAIRHCVALRDEAMTRLIDHLMVFVDETQVPDDEEIQQWVGRWNAGGDDFARALESTKQEVVGGLKAARNVDSPESANRLMTELGCYLPATKGSGTGTVLAAIGIFLGIGDDFREAILMSVNALGSDTDTIAAFVGSLCGAAHGYDEVPREWARALQDYDYFMRVATEVTRIACRSGIGGRALLPEGLEPRFGRADLLRRLQEHEISEGDRVFHPLFGEGWVTSVEAQKLHRKDQATVVLSWVAFDIGQRCKFRYMTFGARKSSTSVMTPDTSAPETLF